MCVCVHVKLEGKQGNESKSSLFYFHRKKGLLRWDSSPRPTCTTTALKAVALPTEPMRQFNWLGACMHACVWRACVCTVCCDMQVLGSRHELSVSHLPPPTECGQ